MNIKEIYKFNEDDTVKISVTKPEDISYEILKRISTDPGKRLQHEDYEELFIVIDVESEEGWKEVDYIEPDVDLSVDGDLYAEFLASRGIPTA